MIAAREVRVSGGRSETTATNDTLTHCFGQFDTGSGIIKHINESK